MQIGMRNIWTETVSWFKSACGEAELSCSALVHEFCRREDWRDARGRLRLSPARKLVPRLADELGVCLRDTRQHPGGSLIATAT